jgi:hypothetical protein
MAFSSYDETNGRNDDSSDAGGDDGHDNNNTYHSNMIVTCQPSGRIRELFRFIHAPYPPVSSLILDTTHCPAQ